MSQSGEASLPIPDPTPEPTPNTDTFRDLGNGDNGGGDSSDNSAMPSLLGLNHIQFTLKDLIYSRLGIGFYVAFVGFIISISYQPKFLMTKPRDPLEVPTFCYRNALILSLLLGSLTVLIPWYSMRAKQVNVFT
jgi:uncharacterized membrane protein (DUF485 family)